MKKWITPLAALGVSLMMVTTSCEKDETRAVLQPGEVSGFTASANALTLTSTTASQPAIAYSWAAVPFGYQAAVTYSLQFAKAGTNFAAPYSVNLGTNMSKAYTVGEINELLVSRLRLLPGTAAQVEVRMKASVGDAAAPVYSATKAFTATPYLIVINYPSLFVPGNYQGWNPSAAPKVSAFTDNQDLYEGYVNLDGPLLAGARPEFKFTTLPSWDGTNFGNGGPATLSNNGGAGNLTVPAAGYYRLKANTQTLTWDATVTTWSIIGSATPGGWNADTPLVLDPATGKWSASVRLVAGELKFRANNDWTINFGDGKAQPAPGIAPDGILDYGADNIAVTAPSANAVTVTLDLTRPGTYTYSIQ